MTQRSCSDLRQNLSRAMDEVIESGVPMLITRQGGQGNVVMLSEAEFESWQETVHLLRSPAMARRLMVATGLAERDLAATGPATARAP